MKFNQRYIKVLGLYFVSVLTSNLFIKKNDFSTTLIQTLIGYSVFATGLKYLSKLKRLK